jgi:hypothetical protein
VFGCGGAALHRDGVLGQFQIGVQVGEAWTIIDRLSQKYLGGPYPLRTDRIVYLIEPEYARAISFG